MIKCLILIQFISKYYPFGQEYVIASKSAINTQMDFQWFDVTGLVNHPFFCTFEEITIPEGKYDCYDCKMYTKLFSTSFDSFILKDKLRKLCINNVCSLNWLPEKYKKRVCSQSALLYEVILNFVKEEFIDNSRICQIFGHCTQEFMTSDAFDAIEVDVKSQGHISPSVENQCYFCKYILDKVRKNLLKSDARANEEKFPSFHFVITTLCDLMNLDCQEFNGIEGFKKLISQQLSDENIRHTCAWLNQCQ